MLLLDEPTASLDGRNEQALRQAIDAISRDRTLILVAHRLATVVDADQILVLEDGRLQAVGTHDDLLRDQPAVPGAGRAPAAGLTAASGGSHGRPRRAAEPVGLRPRSDRLTAAAAARPAIRPENRHPPRNDPSSAR